MKKLSIKTKIMIWFTAALILISACTSAVNFSISREVLNKSIQERLVTAVAANAQEIEFYNSNSGEMEPNDFFLSYNGGILEIDDDFLNYNEGVFTALVDSENNLIYGEMPIQLNDRQAFSYTTVGLLKNNGEKFYIYEKKLSGENLDGLWLRGFISERENTNVLYNMVRIMLWLTPVLAIAALLGGYIITKRSFAPIKLIDSAAREITESGDLSKRINIFADENCKNSRCTPGKDEIQNLAITFNQMFDRLESSFDSEKQFTSDASHELRTPLSVIKANCEYALKYGDSREDFIEVIQTIAKQTDKTSALLNQLLFFARLNQKKDKVVLSKINLSALTTSICKDRQIILPDELNLEADIHPEIFVNADESLMARLLNNLLDNAVKYIGSGTSIQVSLCSNETSVFLSVKDSGIGISPENINKIWNRFYMADPSRSETSANGFGLGLAMVREIAELHHGRMEVLSKPGSGSTFTLILPINQSSM